VSGRHVLCDFCKHRVGKSYECAAFGGARPPQEVIDMDHFHRHPYAGDNGVRFELADDLDAWMLKEFVNGLCGLTPGWEGSSRRDEVLDDHAWAVSLLRAKGIDPELPEAG
jgi:hypothetical protein